VRNGWLKGRALASSCAPIGIIVGAGNTCPPVTVAKNQIEG
jgi:hypothetical protein